MSGKFAFLAEGEMNLFENKKTAVLNSSIAEGYKKKLKEIKTKNEWKSTGTGARFMGMSHLAMANLGTDDEKMYISGISKYKPGTLAYTINSGSIGGIYVKDISNPDEPDSFILVKEKMRFYCLDCTSNKIAAAVSDSYLERHLALVDANSRDFSILTEGECYDSNPSWSAKDGNIIYYDSCGLGYDGNQNFIRYGPKSVFCMNIGTGDLAETLVGDEFDYYKPFEDCHGDLFYIRRPYNPDKKQPMSLKDILLIPVKLLKAIFEWLNFFTQRYSGESLKTTGNNPAKAPQRSPEQIFVDGNLLEAEKNLKQNKALGEENPGYVPSSWELVVKKANGDETVLKKGVLDYRVSADGSILFSNGKYIIKLHETGAEEIMAKAHLASGLADLGDD